MARKYPMKDVKILYGAAARLCSKCRRDLVMESNTEDPRAQIGKIAHIIGHESDGPRGDQDYPTELLDKYDNWILLCGTCHDEVDSQPNTYPVEEVRKIKENHEKWVIKQLEIGMLDFGFTELEIIIRNIHDGNYSSLDVPENYDRISIDDKINKNNLSNKIRGLINSGIFRIKEVSDFCQIINQTDIYFTDNLKFHFQNEYLKLKNQDLDADSIFYELLNFAQRGTTAQSERAASLVVLCYLFQICEVFEK